ncbi:metal-dependent hydrolase [Fictibacillus nanhaiensis]|uniref:metal-dependent hydrolase n=1 Tax=Fictibacillus nanhaiensis TaxID=742169 RepID=UPI002E215D3A|nr:metal-dependent hydrolase [Fictibacillus nanhaiensis]
MDTTSHIVIGLGLGALAQIDPVVSSSSLSYAVVLGTVIGSNAPDADCVFKLKGKGSYFRNHRGWSHSLLALPLWGLAVSAIIHPFFAESSFLHLFMWSFLAVVLHVGFDLFNVYGTQAARPLSSKWISFDSIPLVDPFILLLHVIGFVCIPFFDPGVVFLLVYLGVFIHILYRTLYAAQIKTHIEKYYPDAHRIKVIPQADLLKWDFLVETDEEFLFGTYRATEMKLEHTFPKTNLVNILIEQSKKEKDIADFLYSTEFAHPFVREGKHGTYVMWKDLRFRKDKSYFPYHSIMYLSHDGQILTNTDKIYSYKKYRTTLRMLESKAIGKGTRLDKEYLQTS